MKIGYLGPRGTFSELAALKIKGENEIIPFHTIWDVLENVDLGKINSGIVPIENSIEGVINITLDSIIFDTELFIQKQVTIPIEQNIMVNQNNKNENIKKIYSHPHAIAQCHHFLAEKYPLAERINVNSTAEAAKYVSISDEPIAAIGTENVANIYGLKIIKRKIQDDTNNFTHFIVVSKENTSFPKKGNKFSAAFSTLNEPGQLYKLLDIFAMWDLNMTKIISRPMRNKGGEYVFFVDIEGNSEKEDLIDAFKMLKRKTSFFKILGSYPVYDYRCDLRK